MKDGDARPSIDPQVASLLERGVEALGLPVSRSQVDALALLVALLSHWAQRINLTGHRDPVAIASRLVLDALALARALPELDAASGLADLGSGSGLPGLPIAIVHPELDVHLVDSRLKRHHFQREARRRLGLERVHCVLGRAEEVEVARSDVVVAQAMAQPEQALEWMARWVVPGGIVALPASEDAREPAVPASMEPPELRPYTVPVTGARRKLWVARSRREG